MKKVKLISVGTPTSQGIDFHFEGLQNFNKKWWSWEEIASKMLGVQVEAEKEKPKQDEDKK